MSCKGVNKNSVQTPLETFKSALFDKRTVSTTNRGFRVKGNHMFSYVQEKVGFTYFYCKRAVAIDGVSTSPLDMVVCPWPDYGIVMFDDFDCLGLLYKCVLKRNCITYHSAIQMYEHVKAQFHNEHAKAASIMGVRTATEVFAIARTLEPNYKWYDKCVTIMEEISQLKREQVAVVQIMIDNNVNKKFTYATKFDRYWGCGQTSKLATLTNPQHFPGSNKLGEIWTNLPR